MARGLIKGKRPSGMVIGIGGFGGGMSAKKKRVKGNFTRRKEEVGYGKQLIK